MAAGSSINHPKLVCGKKQSTKKKGKGKKTAKKTAKRNVDPLTTSNILRKTRTNPGANIKLSGKKKRLLLKQLKREEMEKNKMDQDVVISEKPKTELKPKKATTSNNDEQMDIA